MQSCRCLRQHALQANRKSFSIKRFQIHNFVENIRKQCYTQMIRYILLQKSLQNRMTGQCSASVFANLFSTNNVMFDVAYDLRLKYVECPERFWLREQQCLKLCVIFQEHFDDMLQVTLRRQMVQPRLTIVISQYHIQTRQSQHLTPKKSN